MTKDVLVSISGKHIDIMNDPAKGYETGDDEIEVVTPANYYCRNGKHYIIYDEVLEGMAGTVRNKIKITGTDAVEIMKSGLSSSHMVFEKNKKNLTYYATPFGNLQMGIAATKIAVKEEEAGLDLAIDYALEINAEHAADCQIQINVKPKEAGNFSLDATL